MHKPELFALSQIDWQFFATLTFRKSNASARKARSMFDRLVGLQARNFGVHYRNIIWCLRCEFGEATGRKHFHALIGGLPSHAKTKATCFAFKRIWENAGGGMARVYVYECGLDAADYILKGMEEACQKRRAGHFYETAKFGKAPELSFSESMASVIAGRRLIGKRARLTPDKAE
jgi:hypothetical protein